MINDNFKSKKILILGAGLFQIPIIKKARSLGLEVVLTDMYPDPPGKAFADHFIQMDIKNLEGNLKIAREYNVDAVVSDQTDVGIPTVAYICEQLGLKGIGWNTSKKFTNKYVMRSALVGCGIPLPKFHKTSSLNESIAYAKNIGYPIIIKPPASQSSRGVFLIHNEYELKMLYPLTLKESNDSTILVEEYINGIEYTVEGFANNGKVYTLAISDKEHLKSNPCVACRLTYPPAADKTLCESISEINTRIVERLGLQFGITHAEFKVRDGIPYLMEIAARGGGTFISSLIVPTVSGIDVNDLLLKQLFSVPVNVENIRTKAVNLEFLIFSPGKIVDITGLEEACKLPGVLMVNLDFKVGDILSPPTDDRSRHGFMIVAGDTRDDVLAKSNAVRNAIKIKIS